MQKDDALADAERGEILEDLDYLAEEANKPDAKRRPSLLGRIIGGMPNALQAAESAKTAWDTFGPTIGGFFGRTGGS
ncbi:MAG TPA: hypothetical protein VHK65_13885 [Candidatus Dormibacteraeota bacterium]|nr:hypothetical protein [Candidatus Dormibacteraeota bacterium]